MKQKLFIFLVILLFLVPFFSIHAEEKTEALWKAVINQDLTLIKTLLDKGADPNSKDNQGKTALMYAYKIDSIQILLDYGADPFIKTPDGKNLLLVYTENYPLDYSKESAHVPTIKLLLDMGLDPAETDDSGNSALKIAVRREKDNYKAREILNMFCTVANKQEIAEAKKKYRKEKREVFFEEAPKKLLLSAPLLLPLGYLGFSIFAREEMYRDNPDSNWVGSMNAYITGFVAGSVAVSIPFVVWMIFAGEGGFLPLFLNVIIAPIVGVVSAIIIGNNYQSAFREKRGLYYIAPALAGAIAIPIFIKIWRK